MQSKTLDDLRFQVNDTYCIVTRTYDSAGNMTGESRAEHPEPYVKLTHDQGVELLALINKLESERQVTHESAIDFLRNEGWLQKHDEELTKNKEPDCGACGDGLPISAQRDKFCPWCGRPVKRDG